MASALNLSTDSRVSKQLGRRFYHADLLVNYANQCLRVSSTLRRKGKPNLIKTRTVIEESLKLKTVKQRCKKSIAGDRAS